MRSIYEYLSFALQITSARYHSLSRSLFFFSQQEDWEMKGLAAVSGRAEVADLGTDIGDIRSSSATITILLSTHGMPTAMLSLSRLPIMHHASYIMHHGPPDAGPGLPIMHHLLPRTYFAHRSPFLSKRISEVKKKKPVRSYVDNSGQRDRAFLPRDNLADLVPFGPRNRLRSSHYLHSQCELKRPLADPPSS